MVVVSFLALVFSVSVVSAVVEDKCTLKGIFMSFFVTSLGMGFLGFLIFLMSGQ